MHQAKLQSQTVKIVRVEGGMVVSRPQLHSIEEVTSHQYIAPLQRHLGELQIIGREEPFDESKLAHILGFGMGKTE